MHHALYYPRLDDMTKPDTHRQPVALFDADVFPREWVEAWRHEHYRTCVVVPVTAQIDPYVALGMHVVDGLLRGA